MFSKLRSRIEAFEQLHGGKNIDARRLHNLTLSKARILQGGARTDEVQAGDAHFTNKHMMVIFCDLIRQVVPFKKRAHLIHHLISSAVTFSITAHLSEDLVLTMVEYLTMYVDRLGYFDYDVPVFTSPIGKITETIYHSLLERLTARNARRAELESHATQRDLGTTLQTFLGGAKPRKRRRTHHIVNGKLVPADPDLGSIRKQPRIPAAAVDSPVRSPQAQAQAPAPAHVVAASPVRSPQAQAPAPAHVVAASPVRSPQAQAQAQATSPVRSPQAPAQARPPALHDRVREWRRRVPVADPRHVIDRSSDNDKPEPRPSSADPSPSPAATDPSLKKKKSPDGSEPEHPDLCPSCYKSFFSLTRATADTVGCGCSKIMYLCIIPVISHFLVVVTIMFMSFGLIDSLGIHLHAVEWTTLIPTLKHLRVNKLLDETNYHDLMADPASHPQNPILDANRAYYANLGYSGDPVAMGFDAATTVAEGAISSASTAGWTALKNPWAVVTIIINYFTADIVQKLLGSLAIGVGVKLTGLMVSGAKPVIKPAIKWSSIALALHHTVFIGAKLMNGLIVNMNMAFGDGANVLTDTMTKALKDHVDLTKITPMGMKLVLLAQTDRWPKFIQYLREQFPQETSTITDLDNKRPELQMFVREQYLGHMMDQIHQRSIAQSGTIAWVNTSVPQQTLQIWRDFAAQTLETAVVNGTFDAVNATTNLGGNLLLSRSTETIANVTGELIKYTGASTSEDAFSKLVDLSSTDLTQHAASASISYGLAVLLFTLVAPYLLSSLLVGAKKDTENEDDDEKTDN